MSILGEVSTAIGFALIQMFLKSDHLAFIPLVVLVFDFAHNEIYLSMFVQNFMVGWLVIWNAYATILLLIVASCHQKVQVLIRLLLYGLEIG